MGIRGREGLAACTSKVVHGVNRTERATNPHGGDHAHRRAAVDGEAPGSRTAAVRRSEEHTSELQSHLNLVCRLLLEKKKLVNRRRVNVWISNLIEMFSAPGKTFG